MHTSILAELLAVGEHLALLKFADEVDKILLGAVLLLAVEPLSKARASMRPVSGVWRLSLLDYNQSTQGRDIYGGKKKNDAVAPAR